MRIGDAARRAAVSPRALRHYEEAGLLAPARTSGGYRDYDDADVVRAAQVRALTAAGVGTELIRRYLDCLGDVALELCPDLRAELDAIGARLDEEQAALAATRDRLDALLGTGDRSPARPA